VMSMGNHRSLDEQQIRELIAKWAESVRARDIEGVMANHAPDVLLFDVPPPIEWRGIDEYKRSWEQFFKWFGDAGVFEVSQLRVTASDDVAFCHGLIRCGGPQARSDKGELAVRLTVCLRKIDGQWTVTHEHRSQPSTD
jgi:uncharacterized protein (TIGR02246 family)